MSGTDFTKTHGRNREDCKKRQKTLVRGKKMNEDSEFEEKEQEKERKHALYTFTLMSNSYKPLFRLVFLPGGH